MTYNEFKKKWLGKGINFDGNFGNQCVDVYRMYCNEVLNIPQSPPVKGAKNIWDTYLTQYFDRIDSTPTNDPDQGDIIIWDIGEYGHIGICDTADINEVTCFEQNFTQAGTVLDGKGVAELRKHNYNGIKGWLKFKKQTEMTLTEDQQRIIQFLNEVDANEGMVREAFGALVDITPVRNRLEQLETEVKELKQTVKNQTVQITNLTESLKQEQDLRANYQTQVMSANKKIEELLKQIETKDQEIEAVKAISNKYQRLYKGYNDASGWDLIKLGLEKLFVKETK